MWQSKIGDWITAAAGDAWGLYAANQSENFQHGQAEKNRQMQYDFAQHGVGWRVKDATDAGLHPLFALGAQIAPASPVHVGGGDYSGVGEGTRAMARSQDISQAISRNSPEAREALSVQLQVQQSLRDKYSAEADLARSQAMRNYQDPTSGLLPNGGPGGGGNTASGVVIPERNQFNPENTGAIEMTAPKRNSSSMFDRGVEAGSAPGVMELNIPGTSVRFAIPATSDIGETLSEMDNPVALSALLVLNRKMYGPYWIRDFLNEFVLDRPAYNLETEPKPSSYTLHQLHEALEVVRDSVTRDRMPPAKKEWSGRGRTWWERVEDRQRRIR